MPKTSKPAVVAPAPKSKLGGKKPRTGSMTSKNNQAGVSRNVQRKALKLLNSFNVQERLGYVSGYGTLTKTFQRNARIRAKALAAAVQ